MDRKEAIDIIKCLCPADSEFKEVAEKGKQLLMEAICQCWRSLPSDILIEYAKNCEAYNHFMESKKRI